MLIIIFIILIVYFLSFNKIFEHYIAPYNSIKTDSKLDLDSIIYTTESIKLKSLFESYNINNGNEKIDISQFLLIKNDISFNILKTQVVDTLNILLNSNVDLKNPDIYIIGDIENIYIKNNSLNKQIIFDITMHSKTYLFTRKIKVYGILNSNNNILNIKTIELNENISQLEIPGLISLTNDSNNLYLIKNTLYLMDPYLTSNKEMIITQDMKKSFSSIIQSKQKQLDIWSNDIPPSIYISSLS